MKKIVIVLVWLFVGTAVFAQKNEMFVSVDSGLFSYFGESPVMRTSLNVGLAGANSGYANNSYGAKNGFCYGVSASFKRITKRNTLYGATLGYQSLQSKADIVSVNIFSGTVLAIPASGEAYRVSNGLNLFLSVGKRFVVKKIPIDLVGGLNFDYIFKAKDKGNAKDITGATYTLSGERNTIKLDFSPRIQLSTEYKKIGVYAGYSMGLVNYYGMGYVGGGNASAYSKMIRFGISYRLK
jgi:hypothetical protein